MKFNEKITYCRKKLGMSQVDLADRMEVSRQAVSKWETGESSPDIGKLKSLAEIFNTTTDWLLSEEDPVEQTVDEKINENDEEKENAVQAYPDWVDKLPKSMETLVKKYGWLYGVRMAIAGGAFLLFGIAGLSMMNSVSNEWGMNTGETFYIDGEPVVIGNTLTGAQSGPEGAFFGLVFFIALVLIIGGLIIAGSLKSWGEKSLEQDKQ